MSTYDCMTDDEFALWQDSYVPAKVPCTDCPLWFATLAREQGKCCGTPGASAGRTIQAIANWRYDSDEERRAARRESWRESKRRAAGLARARATWDNNAVEYSDHIAHNAQRPASRLYSERQGVDVPEYRRNG